MKEQPKYKVWPGMTPTPHDAQRFRRFWAEVRRSKWMYDYRRQLAHDYAVAKCSGRLPEKNS